MIGDTPFETSEHLEEMSQSSSPGNVPHQGRENADEDMVEIPISSTQSELNVPKVSFGGSLSPIKSAEGAQNCLESSESILIDGTLVSGFRLVNDVLELEFPDIQYQSLAPIVKYLYSTRMDITSRNLVGVFNLVHEMGLLSIEPDILNSAPSLYSEDTIVHLLIEAEEANYGKKLLDSMFFWLASDPSRTRALINSPQLAEIPLRIMMQMISSNMFPDEFELYEKLAQTTSGGEVVDQLLSKLNFQRMTPEQLLRVHNTGKVPDAVILDALKSKVANPDASYTTPGGTSIVYDMTLYGDTQLSAATTYVPSTAITATGVPPTYRLSSGTPRASLRASRTASFTNPDIFSATLATSRSGEMVGNYSPHTGRSDIGYTTAPIFDNIHPSITLSPHYASTPHGGPRASPASGQHSWDDFASHYPSTSSTSQTLAPNISPIKRRRSVAVASPVDPDAAGLDLPTDTWLSEPFQVHSGNWSIALKTRGGMLYKVGLILNHTTNEWDAIRLESWALIIETHTSPVQSVPFNFGETLFTTGKEWFKLVKGKTSSLLGMPLLHTSFKKPQRVILRVKVLFPVPEQISLVFEE